MLCRKLTGPASRGRSGDESQDYGYKFTNTRRRSNSSGLGLGDFKTKFEAVEADPVFEEEYHGAVDGPEEEDLKLEKEDSAGSISGGSVEEEEHAKKV